MNIIDLHGTWDFHSADNIYKGSLPVPGTVFQALEKQGVFGKGGIFHREENRKCPDIAHRDFIFERSVTIPAGFLTGNNRRVFLECDGLDTLATIFVNGKKAGYADNMHVGWRFDVTTFLKTGDNKLRIVFDDTVEFITERQKKRELWGVNDALKGYAHIRKSHCSYGWDWGPQIPDVGIWRNIRLAAYDGARLDEVHVTQKHTRTAVTLTIDTKMDIWAQDDYKLKLTFITPDGERSTTYHSAGDTITIEVKDPEIWWPNGYGDQPLYTVTAELLRNEESINEISQRIGLRTMTVRRKKDKWGESFEFHVNGVSIFAMGGDYIPEDVFLTRVTRERTERLVRDCAKANYNCIRVWGGGIYPSDDFYDLCDEYGLVIWQDLMFACATYDVSNKAFYDSIALEARYNLTRIRHHASLGLVCGNNEMEWGFVAWGFPKPPVSKTEYLKQYQMLFPSIIEEVCPYVFYWPASPSSGGDFDDPNGENKGDAHYWEVWHGNKPFSDYRNKYFRFMSEFGFESFPSMKTIKTFALPEDMNIFSPVMEDHQRCGSGNGKILNYVAQYFRYPKDFDSLVYVSQLSQAEAMRFGVEHWRRNRGRCMGAVYWQLNDNWPVASWASIDYFGRWKALHYAAKRFYCPTLISCEEKGHTATLTLSNESRDKLTGTVAWKLVTMNGKTIRAGKKAASANALSSKEIVKLDFSKELAGNRDRDTILAYSFTDAESKDVFDGTVAFVPYKTLTLPEPSLSFTMKKDETGRIAIDVRAKAFAKFVEIDVPAGDIQLSDNYFDLAPGAVKRVYIEEISGITAAALAKKISVRSLVDTFNG
ncbi:MAG: glycoside hydrolase family 2 protein [Spirochaetes bacterium]|nr:glycoside hydrolase family 2 protein [Spirochaetota bacterium]